MDTFKKQLILYVLTKIDNVVHKSRFSSLCIHGHYGPQHWLQVLEIHKLHNGKFNVVFGSSGRGCNEIWIETVKELKEKVKKLIENQSEEYCLKFFFDMKAYDNYYHPDVIPVGYRNFTTEKWI